MTALKLYRGQGGGSGATERVAAHLNAAGERGMTREELSLATGLNYNTVRSSVLELLQVGRAESGPDTRPTLNGREAEVVRAVPQPAFKLVHAPAPKARNKKDE